jgi:hypothetical protein
MKNILIASLILFTLSAYAQVPLVVGMVPQTTDNATQISYVVLIPQAKLKGVEKNWNSYLTHDSKGWSSDDNGVHTQKNVLVKNISPDRFEMYSRMNETAEGVHLSAWLTQNGRALVSDAPDSGLDLAAKKYVYDFAIGQYREAVQVELKMEQEKQKKMEGELADLLKSKEHSIETVNENEREEKRTSAAIDVTNKDIDNASLDIHDQKQMVKTTASDPNAMKGAEKTLGNLEDDKQDLQKDNRKRNEHLDELEKENRGEARAMNTNEQDMALKTAAIEAQKQTVREVLAKLGNIK